MSDKKKKIKEDLEDIEERLDDEPEEEVEDEMEDLEEDIEEFEEKKQKKEFVCKDEFIKLKYQFSEFVNKYKEYEREFENYKRRTREEITAAREEGVVKAVKALVPALDTFKKARLIVKDESSLNGINLIEKSIMAEFEKLGVKKIKAKGEKFDPEKHNAVLLVENSEVESGTIVEEYEAGYVLGEKVIKFSQVSVAK